MDVTSFFAIVDKVIAWAIIGYGGLVAIDMIVMALGYLQGMKLRIPNAVPVAIILLFIADAVLTPLSGATIALHVGLALALLVAGIIASAKGAVGAGSSNCSPPLCSILGRII